MAHMVSKMPAEFQDTCPAKGFIYVWEMPIRFTHWLNAVCIAILVATGVYIHYPFGANHALTEPYTMGYIRYLHYLVGLIFTFGVLLRLVYVFVGNEYASWRSFYNPLKKDDRRIIAEYFKYYFFLEKNPSQVHAHNPLALFSYFGLFIIFFLQIATGFYLWGINDPNSILFALFGWMGYIISPQYIRLFHYFVVFIIGAFLIAHIYAAVLFDFRTREGGISSIFSGWKTDVNDKDFH